MANPLIIKEKGKTHFLFQIVIAGAGANGSHFFRNLLQMVRTHLDKFKSASERPNFDVDITIVDKDIYEPQNKGNQLCDDDDMEEFKVVALAERYGEHYDIPVKRVTEYIKDLNMLHALFPDYSNEFGNHVQIIKILVGMVDNNKSRQLFHSFFESDKVTDLIYLDAGVEGIAVLDKPEKQFSKEDWERVNSSGFGGQVCCGVKIRGEVLLDPVGQVYTNILEDAHTAFPDESCGALIVNNPQRCMTNQMAAQLSSTYMNNLLHMGSIFTHYVNFNAQFGGCRPVFIKDEVINRAEEIKRQPVAAI
ncbi:thiamine biosynthesis protein ThiF [Paenibacillus aestuarii]|uniref:Thiamine biosynthesis protein ThiF n=1 Tax=Paenibacillus aestuarii TaxID=516965 RepID=A0ABW0K8P8_9BACL